MDPTSIASRYACEVCKTLPKHPVCAQDGCFYHEDCIKKVFDGEVPFHSSATGSWPSGLGKKFIRVKGIQCMNEKLLACEEIDRNLIGELDSRDLSSYIQQVKHHALMGRSAHHMALYGRWHLFGEHDVECDAEEGYKWCENAAEKGDADGKAYQGMCFLHGHGVEKNWDEGYELLVEASSEGSAFAQYKLGSLFYAGAHGFKQDRKRAEKWLARSASNTSNNLNEQERENTEKYLSSLGAEYSTSIAGSASTSSSSGSSLPATSGSTLLEPLPESSAVEYPAHQTNAESVPTEIEAASTSSSSNVSSIAMSEVKSASTSSH